MKKAIFILILLGFTAIGVTAAPFEFIQSLINKYKQQPESILFPKQTLLTRFFYAFTGKKNKFEREKQRYFTDVGEALEKKDLKTTETIIIEQFKKTLSYPHRRPYHFAFSTSIIRTVPLAIGYIGYERGCFDSIFKKGVDKK